MKLKEKKKKYWKRSKLCAMVKEMEEIIKRLREEVIIVEGKRDKKALEGIGAKKVYCAVGRMDHMYKKVRNEKNVIILADLDRKGHWLAGKMAENLWSMGIKSDVRIRKRLGKILRIKYFEELDRRYKEFLEENGGFENG